MMDDLIDFIRVLNIRFNDPKNTKPNILLFLLLSNKLIDD